MLTLLRWLAARFAVFGWVFKTISGLGILLPVALLLKFIGLPVLLVLAVLALPVLFVLFLFGLPVILVLVVGGGLMAFLFALLSMGLVVLKLALFIGLPIFIAWKLFQWMFRCRDNGATPPPATQE